MISLPSKYTVGFAAKSPATYFIDITVLNGGVTQHLYITNQPAATFVYGGVSQSASGSVQSSYLGALINSSGQEQEVKGIGEIDFTIDNTQTGALAALNTLSLIFLNQGSFVRSHSYDYENQPVKVFKSFGTGAFNVDGVSGSADMVPIFQGVMTQAYTYDPTQFQIDCVDRRQADAKNMPGYFITSTTCPHADQNALTKFIPFLIGDFQTPNLATINTSPTAISGSWGTVGVPPPLYPFVFGLLSAAPTIIVDIYKGQSLVSDSQWATSGNIYITTDSSLWVAVVSQGISGSGSQYTSSSGAVGTLVPINQMESLTAVPAYGELYVRISDQGYHPDILDPYVGGPGRTIRMWEDGNWPSPSTSYITDIGNAVDSDINTYVQCGNYGSQSGEGALIGPRDILQVQLPSFTPPGSLITRNDLAYTYGANIDFFVGGVFEMDNAVGGTSGDFKMTIMDATAPQTLYKDYYFNMSASSSGVPFQQEWAVDMYQIASSGPGNANYLYPTWDLVKTLRFGFGIRAEGGDGTKHVLVHHLYLRARTRFENTGIIKTAVYIPSSYVPTAFERTWLGGSKVPLAFPSNYPYMAGNRWEVRGQGISNLFVGAKGPNFTSDMVSSSAPNPVRATGHTTADLIVDPASAVEYILRYKLNVPTSGIDTVSFDLLNNTTNGLRKDWAIAASMTDRKSAYDYIAQLCQECHMSMFVTAAGKYRLVAHDTVASVAYNIGASDIYFDGFPQISCSATTNDAIYNDITVNYGFDYTRSQNARSLYVSDINASGTLVSNLASDTGALRDTSYSGWLGDSIARYGAIRQTKLDCMYIQDSVTAEKSLKKLADWLAFKRLLVTMKLVPNVNIVALEQGDIVKITSDYLTPLFSNSAQFMIVGVTVPGVGTTTDPYITINCIELPSANTGTPILTNRFMSSDDLVHGT